MSTTKKTTTLITTCIKIVISVVLSIALVITGFVFWPDMKINIQQKIAAKMYNAYISGDYETAKDLAYRFARYEKNNKDAVAEDYIKLIELRESMTDWSGTSEELFFIIKDFYSSIHNNTIYDVFYETDHISLPLSRNDMLNKLIPGMEAEYKILPEFNSIMTEFFDKYYGNFYQLYMLYNKDSFTYLEALKIHNDMTYAFNHATFSINEIKKRNPDFELLDKTLDIISNLKDSYNDEADKYFFDLFYVNGIKTLSENEKANARYQLEIYILLERALVSTLAYANSYYIIYNYYDCNIGDITNSKFISEEKIDEYKKYSQTSYCLLALATEIFIDLEFDVDETKELKSIGQISDDALEKYWHTTLVSSPFYSE